MKKSSRVQTYKWEEGPLDELVTWAYTKNLTHLGAERVPLEDVHPAWKAHYEDIIGEAYDLRVAILDGAQVGWTGEFQPGHPHAHGENFGTTLVTHIQAPPSGGELVFWEDGGEKVVVPCRAGLSHTVPEDVRHGVRQFSSGDRIALLAISRNMPPETVV